MTKLKLTKFTKAKVYQYNKYVNNNYVMKDTDYWINIGLRSKKSRKELAKLTKRIKKINYTLHSLPINKIRYETRRHIEYSINEYLGKVVALLDNL